MLAELLKRTLPLECSNNIVLYRMLFSSWKEIVKFILGMLALRWYFTNVRFRLVVQNEI